MDERRRQKKLAKQKSRQKEQRRDKARRDARSLAARVAEASAAPILDCYIGRGLWRQGMANVLLSRRLASGRIVMGVFLVDAYCTGIKDAFARFVGPSEYEEALRGFRERDPLVASRPECLRKLVEGAEAYAGNLGIGPHPDYEAAKRIFGDIRAEDCSEEFAYGKDGKPWYFTGPSDDENRRRFVLARLRERLGPDGFSFVDLAGSISEAEAEQDNWDDEEFELDSDP